MKLPRIMLRHTRTVEPLLGEGAGGAAWGPTVTVPCWVDGKRATVTASDGTTVVATAVLVTDLEHRDALTVGSRVTDPARPQDDPLVVLEVGVFDSAGLPTFDHLEVALG